jgi:ribosomal protein S12 methylthiotransferase
VKQERFERFMEVQARISSERLQKKIGKTFEVMIDHVDEEGAVGRTYADAPEIDGLVFLNGETELMPGDMVTAQVFQADEHDLWAELVNPED